MADALPEPALAALDDPFAQLTGPLASTTRLDFEVYVAPVTCRRGDRRPRALPVCLQRAGGAFTAGLRAWSVGASLVDPSPADAPAGVLPWRYRAAATAAALPGGTRSVTLPSGRVSTDPAEPDRAGAGHGQPQSARAEVLQMRLAYPLADRDPLPAVPRCVPACATGPAHNGQPTAAALALALSHLDPLQSRYAGLPFSPQSLQPPYRPDGHRIAAPSTRRYRLAGSSMPGTCPSVSGCTRAGQTRRQYWAAGVAAR